MDDQLERLKRAVADRNTIEDAIGASGMGAPICADGSGLTRKVSHD